MMWPFNISDTWGVDLMFWNTFTIHSLTYSRSLSLSSIVALFLSSFLSLKPLFLLPFSNGS
jgi:hypothetical protein